MCVCICFGMYVCMQEYMYNMYVFMYMFVWVCTYAHVYIRVHVHMYMYRELSAYGLSNGATYKFTVSCVAVGCSRSSESEYTNEVIPNPVIPEPWVAHEDKTTGKTFYFNRYSFNTRSTSRTKTSDYFKLT